MWRRHSCLPRRDSSRRMAEPKPAVAFTPALRCPGAFQHHRKPPQRPLPDCGAGAFACQPPYTMHRRTFLQLAGAAPAISWSAPSPQTEVAIRGDQFLINGKPTYAGRSYKDMKIEGLLMNVRAVQ